MRNVKLSKAVTVIPREGVVYENEDEFRSIVGQDAKLWWVKDTHDSRESIQLGDYLKYGDGAISEILQIKHYEAFTTLRTICNKISTLKCKYAKIVVTSDQFSAGKWAMKPKEDLLTEIDGKKVRFVELWLFEGLTLEKALQATMYEQLRLYHTKYRNTRGNSLILANKNITREYIRKVLNAPWFDKLLAEDRIIRDRYMNFVGAMESVGLTKERVAEIVKAALESSSEKERINALNRILDIMQVEDSKRPRNVGLVNATYRDVEDEVRHLATPTVPVLSPPQPVPQLIEVPINASPKEGEVSASSGALSSPEQAAESLLGEVRLPKGEDGRESGTKEEYHSYEEAVLEITEEEIRNASEAGK